MKLALLQLIFCLSALSVLAEVKPAIVYTEAELQTYKDEAVKAINSPEVWKRFPKQKHEDRYTVVPKGIQYWFEPDKPNQVIVIVPVTKVEFHAYYVAVTFKRGGEIIDMYEGFWP